MNRIVLHVILILALLSAVIYGVEDSGYTGFANYKPTVEISQGGNHHLLISWSNISYPAYYEVQIFSSAPLQHSSAQKDLLIATYRTYVNHITISNEFPKDAYLRIAANGLFHHPLGSYSAPIHLSEFENDRTTAVKPSVLSHYPQSAPAPNVPLLTWTVVDGAVYYEIEFLSAPPETPNGTSPSIHRLFASREVFTNGYTVNLSKFNGNHLYWRVRALDYDGKPLGVFSDAENLYIDHHLSQTLKPVPNTTYAAEGVAMPLYPVYAWIPLTGAVYNEVEVTSQPPENPNGTGPSRYRIRHMLVKGGFDCYDEQPLITPGTYYWRVRALDGNHRPIGVYSDAEPFKVDLAVGQYAATFGDSITHGGGAVSYSPASVDYNYQTYLSFPAANLGKSGDTSETMLERFAADVLPFHPKYLIILGGTNSLRGGIPASQVIQELSGIRDKCLQNGIRPIFLTLPPINPKNIQRVFNEETAPDWHRKFSAVNQFIRRQPYYIDLEPYFTDGTDKLPTHFAIDGLHFDIEGKKLMAQIINANWQRVTQE
jgi:lysophospholipase L1-like esterase